MDCVKVGRIIYQLRKEKGLTQQKIADTLNISHKTVSKWERGLGCPDVSLLTELSQVLGADMQMILAGELNLNSPDNGNISRVRFYVCPLCGNALVSTGPASIACCGRRLEALTAHASLPGHQMEIERLEDEYYITVNHVMEKSHYIAFIAYVWSDRILLNRLYPEQSAAIRMPIMRRGGKLYAFCTQDGLWMQSMN